MSKKPGKKKEPAASRKRKADTHVDPPSVGLIGTGVTGISLEQARGIQICLHSWTSFGAAPDEPTSITIQEWTGEHWEVREVIGGGDQKAALAHPLDPIVFQGKYTGERVLAVYKPAEEPDA